MAAGAGSSLRFSRLLVVCTGNICRSPMGEVLLRARLAHANDAVVASAGIGAVVDAPAHRYAEQVMAEKGLSLASHRGCQLGAEHGRDFDLLLVMEARQKDWIAQRYPELRGRVFRLGHWLGCDVPDPIGLDVEAFRESRDLIERAVDTWTKRL